MADELSWPGHKLSWNRQRRPPTLCQTLSRLPIGSIVRQGVSSETPPHEHLEEQLIYPEHGYILVETQGRVVRLAADRAVWIPSGNSHSVHISRRFRYHSLYANPGFFPRMPSLVIRVERLLRELILDAERWQISVDDLERAQRKAEVLRDEILFAPRLSAGIEIPDEPRLARICRELERTPSDGRTLRDWSAIMGVSEKTLERLFIARTGLTFQRWRTYVRMSRALELQCRNVRLLDIALEVGYATESAFCQAYKRYYGQSPGRTRFKSRHEAALVHSQDVQ